MIKFGMFKNSGNFYILMISCCLFVYCVYDDWCGSFYVEWEFKFFCIFY